MANLVDWSLFIPFHFEKVVFHFDKNSSIHSSFRLAIMAKITIFAT